MLVKWKEQSLKCFGNKCYGEYNFYKNGSDILINTIIIATVSLPEE